MYICIHIHIYCFIIKFNLVLEFCAKHNLNIWSFRLNRRSLNNPQFIFLCPLMMLGICERWSYVHLFIIFGEKRFRRSCAPNFWTGQNCENNWPSLEEWRKERKYLVQQQHLHETHGEDHQSYRRQISKTLWIVGWTWQWIWPGWSQSKYVAENCL